MKTFNTTGACIPEKHYMVNIQSRIDKVSAMVDAGEYFCMNRARQYGKTTTIAMLRKSLESRYTVISLDFQDVSVADFRTEGLFVQAFCQLVRDKKRTGLEIPEVIDSKLEEYIARSKDKAGLRDLFNLISEWCEISNNELVLIIDEVDSASNNQIFLDFLGQLRSGYIRRETEQYPALQSVILAGVTDIKHLRSKIRDEDQHRVNSPWNIASDFDIDMTLQTAGICSMLEEYASDHGIVMDAEVVAKLIREYTNGYPFLVSRICQIMSTEVEKAGSPNDAWSKEGVEEAVKLLLAEKNTLFDSLTGKLINYPELRKALYSILVEGTRISYNPMQESIVQMEMHGFIVNDAGTIAVANRIFETLLYNLFLSDEELQNNIFGQRGDLGKSIFIKDGKLNLPLIMERFIATYIEVCGPLAAKFLEKDGRELFLLYLKPIINGTGNYYIEAQTRDQRRMDIVIDYLGKQYIIELKIWHGERYNAEGEQQICDYLDYFGLSTGYMLSFNFNKNKKTGVERVQVRGKVLFEGVL